MTTTASNSGAAAAPGQYFDVPGVAGGGTQWQTDYESTKGLAVTLSQAQVTVVNGIQMFKQVDVVTDWLLNLKITQTYTAGTSTLTNSPYAPFNFLGAVKVLVQNQYASIDVENGIDLYLFNMIRPRVKDDRRNNLGANPAGDPVGGTAEGYYTTALAQANQFASQWASSNASVQTILRIPAGQWFDTYWDLSISGAPTSAPHSALVSPQYMAGTTRQITPQITFNPGSSSGLDTGPVNIGTGTGTFSGSANLTFKRHAIYASNPYVLPSVYAWQYRWKTQRFGLGGVSQIPILLPIDAGQVLSLYFRMWDPLANSGLGAPINVNTLTSIQLQYGSGLFRFNGTVDEAQKEFFSQHGFLLPQGVIAFDLGLDERGRTTNSRAINLFTTAGCLLQLNWSGALSSQAYGVLGIESLQYVS